MASLPQVAIRAHLHEAAFHLADVDGRIERVTDIHNDVRAQAVPVARQAVELHLGHRSTKDKVVERHVPFGPYDQRWHC